MGLLLVKVECEQIFWSEKLCLFSVGLVIGTIFLMVVILVMNGLSVVGMVIGVSIVLFELLWCGYDKIMIIGVI